MQPATHQDRPTDVQKAYWRASRDLTLRLLAIWFLVTFGVAFFARELAFPFFGWPFSFWMCAQGAVILYCALIAYYSWRMNRIDAEFGVGDER